MKLRPTHIGIGTGVLALLLLAPATGTTLGDLSTARGEHATLAAQAARPDGSQAVVEPGSGLSTPDAAAARAAIMARIQRLAKAGGVLVEETGAASAPAGLIALRLRVSGTEKAVVAFMDAFEREAPIVRLRNWRVEPVAGGVRLTGEAVAAWQ